MTTINPYHFYDYGSLPFHLGYYGLFLAGEDQRQIFPVSHAPRKFPICLESRSQLSSGQRLQTASLAGLSTATLAQHS